MPVVLPGLHGKRLGFLRLCLADFLQYVAVDKDGTSDTANNNIDEQTVTLPRFVNFLGLSPFR